MNGQEKVLLPSHMQGEITQGGPVFDKQKVDKEIKEAKTNGWGKFSIELLKQNKYALLVAVTLVAILSYGVSALYNAESLNTLTATTSEATPILGSEALGGLTVVNGSVSGEITETAQFGEGVTHLARKAVAQYATAIGAELSAEQRIYAEDYLSKLTGLQLLSLGDKITFASSDIKVAVDTALSLEAWQIENLSQYVK